MTRRMPGMSEANHSQHLLKVLSFNTAPKGELLRHKRATLPAFYQVPVLPPTVIVSFPQVAAWVILIELHSLAQIVGIHVVQRVITNNICKVITNSANTGYISSLSVKEGI